MRTLWTICMRAFPWVDGLCFVYALWGGGLTDYVIRPMWTLGLCMSDCVFVYISMRVCVCMYACVLY